MKIAIAQLNYRIGDIDGNRQKIISSINDAKKQSADLVVFSELAICGYPPKDLLDYPGFIDRCLDSLSLIKQCTNDIGVLIGCPSRNKNKYGKRLRNAAFLLYENEIVAEVHKTLLPTYDIFDEYRYFEPSEESKVVPFKGANLAITICEDLWNLNDDRLYTRVPMDDLMKQEPDLMINLSGSPYSYNHVEERRARMQNNASIYSLPLLYVNQVGGNTDLLFDGGSMLINRKGEIAEECSFFEEDFKLIEWNKGIGYEDRHHDYFDYDISLIHDAVVMGLRDYFYKSGFKKAILGSSGGIDSAVVNALAVEALGSENVHAVLMPSPFSSEGSITDAVELAKGLNCSYEIVPIEESFAALKSTLSKSFEGKVEDVTEENMQARIRGIILMAMSNKFGSILLNTSNKSESAVGYTTLYGDLCGGLSPIADLYKQQVYEMASFLNRVGNFKIPETIINKEPSAELRPNQKDSDSLPEYEILDKVLFHYIEERKGWQEIVAIGYDEVVVRKIVRMVDRNEYKRFQAPPTLRISHKAFGTGRRMPIVASYFN